jgi:hypothetical protein
MQQPKSLFENIYVVAKFFMSKAPNGSLNCISRTLGKFSIVDHAFQGKVDHQDIWVCRVTREIKPGQNSGAFVLMPIEKVDPVKIRKIIPGFYDLQKAGKAALVVPNTEPNALWMLSKATRQIFAKKYYAVIVPIAYVGKPDSVMPSEEEPTTLPDETLSDPEDLE